MSPQPGLVLVTLIICWNGEGVPWFWVLVIVKGSYEVAEEGGEFAVPATVPVDVYGPGNICPGSRYDITAETEYLAPEVHNDDEGTVTVWILLGWIRMFGE